MRSRSVTLVVTLLILAAFGRSALTACAGWNESPAVRAACCDTSDCDRAAADDCCASSETGRHAQTSPVVAAGVVPGLIVLPGAAPLAGPADAGGLPGVSLQSPRPAIYLLLSVLLV